MTCRRTDSGPDGNERLEPSGCKHEASCSSETIGRVKSRRAGASRNIEGVTVPFVINSRPARPHYELLRTAWVASD